jgi:hypothetical protein
VSLKLAVTGIIEDLTQKAIVLASSRALKKPLISYVLTKI